MNIFKKEKGFTLIELLVVVAIIGLLSSVVLAFLNGARAKGDDAAVKTNLHTVANEAELFYLNNNNSYLPISFLVSPPRDLGLAARELIGDFSNLLALGTGPCSKCIVPFPSPSASIRICPPGQVCNPPPVSSSCPTYDPNGTNMFSKDKVIADAIAEAVKRGDGSSCYNAADRWAVAVGLKTVANTSWCVDVGGVAKLEGPVSSAINASTFLCN